MKNIYLFIGLYFYTCLLFGQKKAIQYRMNYNNCFIIKPLMSPSSLEEPQDFNPLPDKEFKDLISEYESTQFEMDSCMEFITGYSHQKTISIDYDCFSKLNDPNKSFIVEIFLNSMFNANAIIDFVHFTKSYEKHIYNFGPAIVFQYSLEGVVETAPHNITIITSKKENRNRKDIKGIVFCSDGIRWTKLGNETSVLSLIERVRINKEYEILTTYDKSRFIPIAHHKIGEWGN